MQRDAAACPSYGHGGAVRLTDPAADLDVGHRDVRRTRFDEPLEEFFPVAVLAARHGIPFYVAIPLSTLDWELRDGTQIPIEERDEDEVLTAWGTDNRGKFRQVQIANPTSPARNPAFDVTPSELITGIITPKGIFKPRDLWRQRMRLGFV